MSTESGSREKNSSQTPEEMQGELQALKAILSHHAPDLDVDDAMDRVGVNRHGQIIYSARESQSAPPADGTPAPDGEEDRTQTRPEQSAPPTPVLRRPAASAQSAPSTVEQRADEWNRRLAAERNTAINTPTKAIAR